MSKPSRKGSSATKRRRPPLTAKRINATNAKQQAKRNQALNPMAREKGWSGISEVNTWFKRGWVEIPQKPGTTGAYQEPA